MIQRRTIKLNSGLGAATLVAALLAVTGVPPSPASAAESVICPNSGNPYPSIAGARRLSADRSAAGHQVRTEVTVTGGSRPTALTVNFISGPIHSNNRNLIHTVGTMAVGDSTAPTSGPIPDDIDLGNYVIYNLVVTDADNCTTVYYNLPGHTPDSLVEYVPSPAGAAPQTHSLDLDPMAFSLVSATEAGPELPDPAIWTPDQHYRNALATVFFGRPATANELLNVADMSSHDARYQATRNLANSEEWAGNVVDNIYQAALDRPADAAGRVYWAQLLWTGGKTRDIAVSIYGSAEAFNSAGGTNEGYITGLYNRILERDPDAAGLEFWVTLLSAGDIQPTDVV